MSGAIGSISGCQCMPILSSPSKWTNGLHGCWPRLSRTNLLAGPKPHLLSRGEKSAKKRQPLCRKPREVLVIVLQDYPRFISIDIRFMPGIGTPGPFGVFLIHKTSKVYAGVVQPK